MESTRLQELFDEFSIATLAANPVEYTYINSVRRALHEALEYKKLEDAMEHTLIRIQQIHEEMRKAK